MFCLLEKNACHMLSKLMTYVPIYACVLLCMYMYNVSRYTNYNPVHDGIIIIIY